MRSDLGERHPALGQHGDDPLGGQTRRRSAFPGRRTATVAPALASAVDRLGAGGGAHRHPARRTRRRAARATLRVGDQPAAADDDQVVGGVLSSLIRWLETSTARPSAARTAGSRASTMPSGSSPLTGSSSISTGGSPSSAAAMPSRCRMPSEYPPARARPTARQADLVDHLVDPRRRDAVALRQPQQMVAGRCGRGAPRVGVEQRADLRAAGRRSARYGRPPTSAVPAVGRVQPEDHPHRGRLAGAVRPDEPGDLPGPHGERQAVDGDHLAVAFSEVAGLNRHGCEPMAGTAAGHPDSELDPGPPHGGENRSGRDRDPGRDEQDVQRPGAAWGGAWGGLGRRGAAWGGVGRRPGDSGDVNGGGGVRVMQQIGQLGHARRHVREVCVAAE